uniref:Uncharacterized protein n=1 Tax=Octopus bimaculoides TaxID=37653 RepID=A0A0L8GWP8_OCTBM
MIRIVDSCASHIKLAMKENWFRKVQTYRIQGLPPWAFLIMLIAKLSFNRKLQVLV